MAFQPPHSTWPRRPEPAPSNLPAQPLLQAINGKRDGLLGFDDVGQYRMRCAVGPLGPTPTARFSRDGRHIAIGTCDGVVHVFETEVLLLARGGSLSAESALRRYTDHADAINDVDFHPSSPMLVSASEDATLQFYDVAGGRLAPARTCTDTHPARSASFHPRGDHLLVGTTHAALHLYEWPPSDASCLPTRRTITVLPSPTLGNRRLLFASCAASEVKLWDGQNCACVATLSRPHGGTPVEA